MTLVLVVFMYLCGLTSITADEIYIFFFLGNSHVFCGVLHNDPSLRKWVSWKNKLLVLGCLFDALVPTPGYKGGRCAVAAALLWKHLRGPCFPLTATVACRTLLANNSTASSFWCQKLILKLSISLFPIQRLCQGCLFCMWSIELSSFGFFFC